MAEGSEEVTNNAVSALIALVVGFVLGLVVVWIYWVQRERLEQSRFRRAEEERVPLTSKPEAPEEESPAGVEPEPDDLTRVEGIGPKMSSVLAEAGVVTFGQLAEREPDALKRVLREEGLQFADPSTWPEQAALAAKGAWDELDALQEELSGGRRVG